MRLRPLRLHDEAAALAAHAALAAEGFTFLLDHRPAEPWPQYVARREANRRGEQLPAGDDWVPETFLAAVVEGAIVGRVSVRHHLNDWLASFGGHIGYAVMPDQRRRGYATEILRQALIIARSVGIDDVLVICDADNLASARTIERCGGSFESLITDPGRRVPLRRYWIG